ncbi:MAG: hypothetical protein E7672_09455 [Ruminococcaceae bacterium]|nr:hypothetical protein [Oscillospiraceae bacterium]
MNKFKQKLFAFMYGRYGIDEFYYGLFVLWLVLLFVNVFVDSVILALLGTVVVVYMLFRSMSKNHVKRRSENAKFLSFWRPIKRWFLFQRDKFRDRKNFRYRKCSHCKAIVKLPNKKGKHTVVCPKCRERFSVKI